MITITRLLARQLRAVFRRIGIRRGSSPSAWIVLLAEGDRLRVRIATPNVAVEHHVGGNFPAEQIILPYEFLADCEGSKNEPVVLETQGKGKTLVRWSDRSVPQMAAYHDMPPNDAARFPAMPDNFLPNDPGNWQALHDAIQIANNDSTRFALDSLQLRGTSGQIAATDGRQILLQSGFQFPWQEELLVPATAVLGCSDLVLNEPIAVGKTDDWVVLGVGAWSVFLKIDKGARFPKLDDLVRPVAQAPSRLELSASDSRFLIDALPRLPSNDELYHPITLDFNGQAIVRAADEERTSVTELLLSGSRLHGEPVLLHTNRQYLLRAARMGFRDIYLFSPETPAQCDDGRRRYLWALLDPKSALRPTDNPIRVDSSVAAVVSATTTPISTIKRRTNMPRPSTADTQSVPTQDAAHQLGATAAAIQDTTSVSNPIVQAEALRGALREALGKTSELITSLKRQRRQSKLVQSTLAALQELRTAG